jgi:septal ring factor EnvC (AmiA/AmiB activator)
MRISSIISPACTSRTLPRKGPSSAFIPFVAVFIVVLMVIFTPPIFGQQQKKTTTTAKDLSDFRSTIHRLQQGIIQQESKIADTQSSKRNILAELEVLDTKLITQQEKLEKLENKMQQQQEMIDREQKELIKIRSQKVLVENHLQKRITAYYTMGDIGLLNVTFSSKTLPELLTFHDSFDVLIKYDQDVIRAYGNTIQELVRVTTALDLEKLVLEDFIQQTVQEKELLQKTKTEKKELLTHIRTQEKLHKQAIVEMQQASEDLAESIVSVKNKERVYEQGFLVSKGSLPPPVDGTLITFFHQEKINKLGISRNSAGIELQAPDGNKIVSVSDGEVIYSGYLRGYGNTVIIHHGFQYYTVTSRIEKILVKKGQEVKKKGIIGIMGDTATLFDEGLYFEIRHGRESLDPLLWLNKNKLSNFREHQTDQAGANFSPLPPIREN